jgi:hypothetical protein
MAAAEGNGWRSAPSTSTGAVSATTRRRSVATAEARLTCWKRSTLANDSCSAAKRGGFTPAISRAMRDTCGKRRARA